MWQASAPVVVGIDGSDAAINAAKWAIYEAVHRDVPLRLVQAVDIEPAADSGAHRLEVQYAETSLRAATAAVEATGKPVKIETEILWGSAENALIAESRPAAMMCLGSVGIGAIARALLGSTAAALADNAYCPVAIIRTHRESNPDHTEWIFVVVEDRADIEVVMEYAMKEGRLREVPVLAVAVDRDCLGADPNDELDRRVDEWKRRYPDVHIYPIATQAEIAAFLANNRDHSVRLAIVRRANAPYCRTDHRLQWAPAYPAWRVLGTRRT